MKYLVGLLLLAAATTQGQSLVGSWQQTENKTCFESQMTESETEKELVKDMGGNSKTSVANVIKFDKKGRGEEGIFSKGNKKGDGLTSFRYSVTGNELQLLDKKSGIMTQHFIIDELSESTLRIHDAVKDCETRVFTRVK